MYFRVKRTGACPYLQIVGSFREARRVRQRVLAAVGRLFDDPRSPNKRLGGELELDEHWGDAPGV